MVSEAGSDLDRFQRRISATTIVNHAVARCSILGIPLTEDNVILCVGDFFDPLDPVFESLIDEILLVLAELFAAPVYSIPDVAADAV